MANEFSADDWRPLEPTGAQRRRIERRVFEWLEARETSIAAEWLGLLRIRPVVGLAYAAVGALAFVLFTPFGWLVAALLP